MGNSKLTAQKLRGMSLDMKKWLVRDSLKEKGHSQAETARNIAQSLRAVNKRKWQVNETISVDVFRALLNFTAKLEDAYAEALDELTDSKIEIALTSPRPVGRPKKNTEPPSKRARGAPRKYSEIYQQGILSIAAEMRAKIEKRGTGKVTDKAICEEILRVFARADNKSEVRYIAENLKRFQNILSMAKKVKSG